MKYAIIGSAGGCEHILDVLESKKVNVCEKVEIYHYGTLDSIGDNAGVPIKGNYKKVPEDRLICLGVGEEKERAEYYHYFKEKGFRIETLIHRDAHVSNRCEIDEGSVVLQGAVVVGNARIGKCCWINNNAVVSHDNKIGDFVAISAGVMLAGHVKVGDFSLLGTGAVVFKGVTIGKECTLACGVVAFNDVADGTFIKPKHS